MTGTGRLGGGGDGVSGDRIERQNEENQLQVYYAQTVSQPN